MRIGLNGPWSLYMIPPEKRFSSPENLKNFTPITGEVPGNLELDLWHAGYGGDPFIGLNSLEYRKYEYHDFWYLRSFSAGFSGKADLILEGVDCFAEIFLNDEKIGSCENSLIPHSFPVMLRKDNTLAIRIISAEIAARKYPDVPGTLAHAAEVGSSLYARRPAHVTGWDILPRLALGGLWKGVYVEQQTTPFRFHDLWVQTRAIDRENHRAVLRLFYHFSAGEESLFGCTLTLRMKGKKSFWEQKKPAYFTSGTVNFEMTDPELWNPRAYGEPNLYDLSAELRGPDGKMLANYHTNCGIRTVELERTEENINGQGKFAIKVNGRVIRIYGSNHVPFDALHSRDGSRMEKTLAMFDELNCNMIRCWGGGIYEGDEFYDWCDRKGVLVWQDFMFACEFYPQTEEFFSLVKPEINSVVKRLRRHPSLILWCGDNETDQSALNEGLPLKHNRLSREILPAILQQQDPSRPYLPSSPYIPAQLQEKYTFAEALSRIPEVHLWGNREFFKLPYYADPRVQFISETGWLASSSLSTMKKYFGDRNPSYEENDPVCELHSTNNFGPEGAFHYRVSAIAKALQEYFTSEPENLLEYIRQSWIFQAEALKFQVENVRLSTICTGILWWNMVDGWPQSSDAVVDYYMVKKLAFHYLKRSQNPFVICCAEPDPWESEVVALNDSREKAEGSFTVEHEHGQILSGTFSIPPFSRKVLGKIRSPRGKNALWLIKWNNCGVSGANHYISGNRFMDFQWYLEKLPMIAELDGSFDPEKLGL